CYMATQMQSPALAGLSGTARRLVLEGILAENDARDAMRKAVEQRLPLAAWLIQEGMVDSARMAEVTSAEFGIPLLDAAAVSMQHLPMDQVSEALVNKHQVLPL